MDKESFFQDVYEVARLIPEGRVTTYGAIANYLGVKKSPWDTSTPSGK